VRTAPATRPTSLVLIALGLTAVSIAAAAEPSSNPSPAALQACASIADTAARLACYDQLAGRSAPNAQAATPQEAPAPTSQQAPAPTAKQAPGPPPATPHQSSLAPSATASSAPTAPPAAGSAASAAAPPSSQTFGLYSAEHPKPAPAAKTFESAVVSLGKSANGRPTVLLDGDALWELDEADPLLAVGDVVTITRAALGSYLMQTPTRRLHRVRRLR
jgi:hypothetical protein